MKSARLLFFALAFVASAVVAQRSSAMSVRAPTFPELVAESATVVHARIVSVTSRSVAAPDGTRSIKTFVTFTTLKSLKGTPAAEFTLSFLGGTEKGERWFVPGMPTFERGEETYVFTTGQESICPLVGAMHGRYRVLTEATGGRRYVARDNHEPLTNTSDVVLPMDTMTPRANLAPSSVALSPEEFESRVTAEIQHPSRPAALP